MRFPWSLLFSENNSSSLSLFLSETCSNHVISFIWSPHLFFFLSKVLVFLPKPGFLYNLYGLIAVVWVRTQSCLLCFLWLAPVLQHWSLQNAFWNNIRQTLQHKLYVRRTKQKKSDVSKRVRITAELIPPRLLWPLAPHQGLPVQSMSARVQQVK